VGAAFVALGAIAALAIPARRRTASVRVTVPSNAGSPLGDHGLVAEPVRID
jgi:hypothetical protein